jgi:hypothetical protein
MSMEEQLLRYLGGSDGGGNRPWSDEDAFERRIATLELKMREMQERPGWPWSWTKDTTPPHGSISPSSSSPSTSFAEYSILHSI